MSGKGREGRRVVGDDRIDSSLKTPRRLILAEVSLIDFIVFMTAKALLQVEV